MKNLLLIISTLILSLNCKAQTDSLYFGLTPPGEIPLKFAPTIITGFKHSAIAISQNGNEIFWTETEMMTPQETRERIKYSEYINGNWSVPVYAGFITDYLTYHNGATVFSPDGKLFFNSDRPGGLGNNDVYYAEKNENSWDSAIHVSEPYNTADYDISPVFTDSGRAYRIGYTNNPASFLYSGDTFSFIEPIENNPVSEWYSSTYISPDEQYMIFAGDDIPNLYIRFKNSDNKWGNPINMGDLINTSEDERFPVVSPDGKYLFFLRGEGVINNYYWVSTSIIEDLKTEANRYFGQTPPGDKAEIFAAGIVSLPNRGEYILTFSTEYNECNLLTVTSSYDEEYFFAGRTNNTWSGFAETPYFASFFPSDGKRVIYEKAGEIYSANDTTGGWGIPTALPSPINSTSYDDSYSETADGAKYICSNRPGGLGKQYEIWRIDPLTNQAENLGPIINATPRNITPCIAPDESYLIYTQSNGYYEHLYISFNKGDGEWTVPINMDRSGANINTHYQSCSKLSPDGKYLFYNSHNPDYADSSDIYWVSTSIIDTLKTLAFTSSVETNNSKQLVSLKPNPTSGTINISFDQSYNQKSVIEILNIQGNTVLKRTVDTNTATLDLTNYPTGMYFVKVNTGTERFYEKFIKK